MYTSQLSVFVSFLEKNTWNIRYIGTHISATLSCGWASCRAPCWRGARGGGAGRGACAGARRGTIGPGHPRSAPPCSRGYAKYLKKYEHSLIKLKRKLNKKYLYLIRKQSTLEITLIKHYFIRNHIHEKNE